MISQPLFEKLLFSIDCDSLRGPQLANANRLKKKLQKAWPKWNTHLVPCLTRLENVKSC